MAPVEARDAAAKRGRHVQPQVRIDKSDTAYYTGTGISRPTTIAAGPDGALWFTNLGTGSGGSIGRITTAGVVTNFSDPSIGFPRDITAGPDGALWFTKTLGGSGAIGRVTTTGTFSSYTDPVIAGAEGITAGPDGALWFANSDSIGRITTAGVVTKFTAPQLAASGGIAAGPDGALWFTNEPYDSIGRITTVGVVTEYSGLLVSGPVDITAGPDGGLWFTNGGSNSIGRISTAGGVTNFPDRSVLTPVGITKGADGNLWFVNQAGNSIGRITPATVPGLPQPVFAVPNASGSAKVVWRAPTANGGAPVNGYRVTPYLGAMAQPPRTFNSTATNAVIGGLQNGKTYQFVVAARNDIGWGAPSTKSPAMIVGTPGQPGQPNVARVAAGSLKATFAAPGNNGAAITNYAVTCTSSNGGATKSKSGSASPITVTGLTAGKSYTCTVKATNSRGTGPLSVASAVVHA